MHEINWKLHPIHSILRLRDHLQPSDVLLLANYTYIPQTNTNSTRVIIPIPFSQLSIERIMQHMQSLEPGRALAIQSQVDDEKMEKVRGHLLFADCIGLHADPDFTLPLLPDWNIRTVDVYRTNRSHHVYFPGILPEYEWLRFLGRLLLWNPPSGLSSRIDTRWVGHALEYGYAALRWSPDPSKHEQAPLFSSRQPISPY